jgi:hypothetical protein
MYVMLDNSFSMAPVSNDLWDDATSALTTFAQDPGSDAINLAFRTYGGGCTPASCSAADCKTPFEDYGSLADATHQANIVAAIAAANPNQSTPHTGALHGAVEWAEEHTVSDPGGVEAVVYISDGACCGAGFPDFTCGDPIATIAGNVSDAFLNFGVSTYVVALPGSSLPLLTAVATAGGTTLIDLTASADIDADVTTALQKISAGLLTCGIVIPNAGQVDPNDITVEWDPTMGPTKDLTQVANLASCTGGDEFYLDNPGAPTQVVLCPVLCADVQSDVGAAVEIIGGCLGGYVTFVNPPIPYFADCSGYPNSGAVWEYMHFDTDVPGDATVVWEIRTGDTAAEAAVGAWTEVAVSTNADPDATPGSPVNIQTLLGSLDSIKPYMELQITINPTSAGNASPIVYDWDIQYSCLSNE